jgi:DNA-binding NtrC family response regulator
MQRDALRSRPAWPVGQQGSQGARSLKEIAKEAIREMERNAIIEALRANHWNRRKAAQELKISYRALIYKIRDAGLIVKRPAGQVRSGNTPASA